MLLLATIYVTQAHQNWYQSLLICRDARLQYKREHPRRPRAVSECHVLPDRISVEELVVPVVTRAVSECHVLPHRISVEELVVSVVTRTFSRRFYRLSIYVCSPYTDFADPIQNT